MQRLTNRDRTPPDGFRYVHTTGFISKAIDHYNWMLKIAAHQKGNGLPPVSEAAAEEQLCSGLPPGNCEHDSAEQSSRPWVNTRLRWSDIVEGTKAYLAFIASGFESVPQAEANRRAAICSACFLNVQVQGCGSCLKLASLVTGTVAGKSTPHDDYLANKACAGCGCPTKSIVHFPMNLLDQADTPEKQAAYTEFCWRKHGSVNRVESNL